MDTAPPPFLDVPALLQASEPRPRLGRAWLAAGGFLLALVLAAVAGASPDWGPGVAQALFGVMLLGLTAALGAATVVAVRRHRAAQQEVEAVAELVQLRHWPQAAGLLGIVLSRPARTPSLRAQALVFLAAVLARYHRFPDAITVHEHLLAGGAIDQPTAHAVRVGRAMAMLREDHLFDADRAIAELRRESAGTDSAGVALVEMYRDVKTGHPAEAVAVFEDKLPAMRDQLGHRVADAYALAARAYHQLGRDAEAQSAFANATLLAPRVELYRRYPEVEPLEAKYQASPAPPQIG